MSHTPGPWRVVQRRAAGAFTPKNGLTLRHLAVDTGCVVWTPSQVQTGGYTEDHLAQARLIAAAPELLVKLKEIKEWADDRADINWNDQPNDAMEVQSMIGNLIAKATGGAE